MGSSFSDNPGKLWSLWDMLQIDAQPFVKVGESFALIDDILSPDNPQTRETAQFLGENLFAVADQCAVLQMPVTHGMIDAFYRSHDKGNAPTHDEARIALQGIRAAFKVELRTRMFMQVLPHRVPYYSDNASPQIKGREIAQLLDAVGTFPTATYDVQEAGNCFAFERFTASAYHLMRAAEHGLVAVADKADVKGEQQRSWDKMIVGIYGHMKKLESQARSGWVDERNKFGDFCSWFIAIKNGWRNPVSHVPRIYLEGSVRGMFAATTSLFQHLQRAGFAPVPMPTAAIALPDDEESNA